MIIPRVSSAVEASWTSGALQYTNPGGNVSATPS